jgi:hypothetical protein
VTAITYIRDADRTRVIFVLDLPPDEAQAKVTAPLGFRLAAVNPDADTSRIPMDGDDYGAVA